MSQREDVLKFEQGRIKALQEERMYIQKKTFTKWMNSFLAKARMEVDDLFVDLADGKKLLKLLEIISGEKLGKPNNGKMRVHKIENVNKSLAFLHTKVRLESIGAEDIVDGNPRLILGLIWTIILRFQIQEIEINVDDDNETSEKKSAKDALLLWCQRKTAGYPYVSIQDFSGSWRNGMGFNALIHSHRPDLIDYNALNPHNHLDNLQNAFDIAQRELGIAKLLDAEDMDTNRPDEKSVITYVASYYHTFARMKSEMKGGRRIANIVGQMMEADNSKDSYNRFTTDLLEWIQTKVVSLEDRNFPNSIEGIQRELLKFKQYRTVEKPPRYKEKSEIEAMFFTINTQLAGLRQPSFLPPEGLTVHDLERAWNQLEHAEHRREVALREELLRQERLEHLAYKFERKGVLRDGYLKEMIQVLSDPRYGSNLSQVEATVKKHEAISADILARKERFHDLTSMAQELEKENYHGKDRVQRRLEEILKRWGELLALLEKHRVALQAANNFMALLRELDNTSATLKELEDNFRSEEVGRHLLAADDLLQKHSILESQIASLGDLVKKLNKQANSISQNEQMPPAVQREGPLLQEKLAALNSNYDNLIKYAKARRGKLEDARVYFQFLEDHEEEEAWVLEKQRICQAGVTAKDLRAVISLQQKHKALLDEMKSRWPKAEKLLENGKELQASGHPESVDIGTRMDSLKNRWELLQGLAASRKKQLEDAAEAYQFYGDANEAESWLKEKLPLVRSTDHGVDEPSAQALQARHRDLEGQIKAYEVDIQSLNAQADKLVSAGVTSLMLAAPPTMVEDPVDESEEWVQETKLVPVEEWEEEPYERTEYKTVTEERLVPQVKALYPFSGQGMEMAKGEVTFLLQKTNEDWWNVRKADGRDGFVPANYVKEIEAKRILVQVRQPVVVRDVRKVKKTKMVKQTVPVKKIKPRSPVKKQPGGRPSSQADLDSVEKRKKTINDMYSDVLALAAQRHANLEDAIRLFAFHRECDDFEKWIGEKERFLQTDVKGDNVEIAKRKFEQCVTDLSASRVRLEAIDKQADELVYAKHSQAAIVRQRKAHIHALWDKLNKLLKSKEHSLQGATSVELFHRTCDEARDWMLEKMTKIDTEDLGRDLQTVQALQRKHTNLERELAPLEEKTKKVHHLAASVTQSYPEETRAVNGRLNEIQSLWEEVKNKALARRARLQQAVGQQIFLRGAKNLLLWVGDVKELLNTDATARDVATAQGLLKKHQELGDDIRAHQDEFAELEALGVQILQHNPDNKDVREKLEQLEEERKALWRGWQQKEAFLQQSLDLQLFNREADQADAATSSQEAILDNQDLGSTLDEVEALIKRHEDFENTLIAQDERLKSFSDMADKLIKAGHYDSPYISGRRDEVVARRDAVKRLCAERAAALAASRAFHELAASVEDTRSWLSQKRKAALDESYRDLNNLERKLQKHEAFERELRATEGLLKSLNKTGQGMIAKSHPRKDDIALMLDVMNAEWEELVAVSKDKGVKLRQAAAQHAYNRTLDDAKGKLDDFEIQLKNEELGSDLRSCRELAKKHQNLEQEMGVWEQKIGDLVNAGQDMADGHFDAESIIHNGQEFQDRLARLKDPMAQRRVAIEEALRFHKFNFEIDVELQWIKERMPAATSETLGQDLHQAQSLDKKHKKLEAELVGHQSVIDHVLHTGDELVGQKHPERHQIEAKCKDLKDAWKDLCEAAANRRRKLDLSLKAQQFFFEAEQIESWIGEKTDLMNSPDVGKDEDAAVKLLTKHKAFELELDTYSGLASEMGHMAQAMVTANHPDAKLIAQKQQLLSQGLKSLHRAAVNRRQRLMECMHRHEYLREADSLLAWMQEQLIVANSEDYGQDYEHLLTLQNKFEDFKHRLEGGAERFNQCDELAKKLISNENPYARDAEIRQEQLRSAATSSPKKEEKPAKQVAAEHVLLCDVWGKLLEAADARDRKLAAAGEIHRYNRDVSEALSRIQEKLSAIPEDLGRDLNSVLSLLRRHEGFENDLVALEAQLQVLMDDSVRLQSTYPGTNADHIKEQQAMVIEHWEALQERSAKRKEELLLACEFHRFLSSVRDLSNWAQELRNTMAAEDKVRDASGAQTLRAEHERLKAEIEAREDSFGTVKQVGEQLIQDGHPMTPEIQDKLRQLLEDRNKLHMAWHQKQVYLDQLLDLHFFLRDAKQIDAISSAQEAGLLSTEIGSTVEEITVQVKKHEAFEKLVAVQEEKLAALDEHGNKLIAQKHFESPLVQQRIRETTNRRAKVKELSAARRNRLKDALLYAQFARNVSEADLWIDERQKQLDSENQHGPVTTLEEKVKRLQKHQTFQAELSAHQSRINDISHQGDTLLAKRHEAAREINMQLEALLAKWKQLLSSSNAQGRGLEEAQDILEFNNQIEKAEAWMRDKEMMVHLAETGRDYEHCLSLQRKLDDVDSDMRVDEKRLKAINALADKLVRQGNGDVRPVQQRREQLNQRWKDLQGNLEKYRDALSEALELHAFHRDLADTDSRISEKAVLLQPDDKLLQEEGSLTAVEALQRGQEAIERDLTAIEGKLREHESEARRLTRKYPDKSSAIHSRLSDAQNHWRELQDLSAQRRAALAAACVRNKFVEDLKELESWVLRMIERMDETGLANDIATAEATLQLHQERKAEIDGRQHSFSVLKDFGHKLVQSEADPATREHLTKQVARCEELRRMLAASWEERRQVLLQCLQRCQFLDMAEQVEAWLARQEAFLSNDDIGDSLSSVEMLIRKHDSFDRTVAAQGGRVEELERVAHELTSGTVPHYDAVGILNTLDNVLRVKDRVRDMAAQRRRKLHQSKQLFVFLRNVHEVEAFISEKMQVACDENYRDVSNLQSKVQKQIAFDAELQANRPRVASVTSEGENLIAAGHFASMEIRNQLDTVESLWRQLQEASALKKKRLNEAYQAMLFSRNWDDLESWMDEVEEQLQNEDHGKDLTSISHLLKKHQALEADINGHAETVGTLKNGADAFVKENHFLAEEILTRTTALTKRYHSLYEPLQIRRENLEDAQLFHQLLRDIEDEVTWLNEKEPLVNSTDLGTSLASVQSLQKKHQVIDADIQAHEPLLLAIQSRAKQVIKSGHFAAPHIETKVKEMMEKLEAVKDSSAVRRLRLLDAVESQMFYTEATEAEAWIREKRPLLTSVDVGKDEDSVQSLLKKLEALERDISGFNSQVGRLIKLGQGLIDRGHFDAANVQGKMAKVESQYTLLQQLCEERHQRLNQSRKLLKFLRDADEFADYLNEQTNVAASEDYGRDVEHVEILIQKFDNFLLTLDASGDKLERLKTTANNLLAEHNPEPARIRTKMEDVQQMWDDLHELAHARQEALAGAKQVHVFDRSADETVAWIAEKDAALSSEDFGQDLEGIQSLARRHIGLERDLAAVKEQVELVVAEAGRLSQEFPSARDHIAVRLEETVNAWNELLDRAALRKDKLQQAEQLQAYFDDYRELMAWVNEMIAKVTAPDLAKDVSTAEAQVALHDEYRDEIQARAEAFSQFALTGNRLIDEGHFLAEEIQDKVATLNQRHTTLLDAWRLRQEIYQQNWDTLVFKRDAALIDSWLDSREAQLKEDHLGVNIREVEELIRRHDDFQQTLEAQEEKLSAIRRITLLEEAFANLKKREEEARKLELQRREQERLDAARKKEVHRLANERRQEEQRRRTQEIKITREDMERMNLTLNGDMKASPAPPARSVSNSGSERADGSPRLGARDTSDSPSIKKLNSQTSLLQPYRPEGVKRAESMKVGTSPLDSSKLKRTPSFMTRRHTQSFRKHKKMDTMADLPPVEIEGYLDRKQEFQSGGKKAAIRSWKNYYTVLCGQLLCFFKDHEDFAESKAAAPPLILYQALCERATDYTKRKNVFRVRTTDGAEYLFAAHEEKTLEEWVNKIVFHANLAPSQQLLSYDSQKVEKDVSSTVAPPALALRPAAFRVPQPVDKPEVPRRSFQEDVWVKRPQSEEDASVPEPVLPRTNPPPLPQSRPPIPPRTLMAPPPRPPTEDWDHYGNGSHNNGQAARATSYSSLEAPPVPATRPSSMPSPPRSQPPVIHVPSSGQSWSSGARGQVSPTSSVGTVDSRHPNPSDTSSESDVPLPSPRKDKDGKDKGRGSVLGIFKRRKGAQV